MSSYWWIGYGKAVIPVWTSLGSEFNVNSADLETLLRIEHDFKAIDLVDASVTVQMDLTYPFWIVKNFDGSALTIQSAIGNEVNVSLPIISSFEEKVIAQASFPVIHNILSDTVGAFLYSYLPSDAPYHASGNVPPGYVKQDVVYRYRVTLDGNEYVTLGTERKRLDNLIRSISVTYGIDSFCGEMTIVWNDYRMYEMVAVAEVGSTNFAQTRINISIWQDGSGVVESLGDFFIEKRSTTVKFGDILPETWGRGKTAILTTPYCSSIYKVWSDTGGVQAATAAYEMAQSQAIPIALDWRVFDYHIEGGNLDIAGETPLEVITKLAEEIGGVVTCKKDGTLVVMYRYGE